MSINKNIECEIRGCITRGDFNDIRKNIEKDFGKISESPELVVFFKGNCDLRLVINKNGGNLVFKETVDSKNHARRETEFKFPLDNIIGVLNFLTLLGFNKGLFSYCYRFDTNNTEQKISIKFDTKIGDLFEIEQVVDEKASFDKIQAGLSCIATKYGLIPWTQEAYKQIMKESWADVNPESLLINNKPHFLIKRVIKESSGAKKLSISKISIAKLLKEKSNDYSFLEKKFKRITKENLLSWNRASLVFEPTAIVLHEYPTKFISIFFKYANYGKGIRLYCLARNINPQLIRQSGFDFLSFLKYLPTVAKKVKKAYKEFRQSSGLLKSIIFSFFELVKFSGHIYGYFCESYKIKNVK